MVTAEPRITTPQLGVEAALAAKSAQPLPSLRPARVHEVEGLGRTGFALYHLAQQAGACVWITLRRQAARLMPMALPQGLVARLYLIEVQTEDDLLWATEEALRAAPVGLVVAWPQKPLSLTAGRRLQLAAEAGATTGLMAIGMGQGSPAVETRWQATPVAGAADSTGHLWRLTKNKSGTIGEWVVNWNGTTASGHLVDAISL